MNILLPRILVSASLISMALLLASAIPVSTPPGSPNPERGLATRGLPILTKAHAPGVTVTETYPKVPERFWTVTDDMEKPDDEGAMVKILTEAATIIEKLPVYSDDFVVEDPKLPKEGKAANFLIAHQVLYAIVRAKSMVSTFKSEREAAIKGIEACEEAVLSTRTRSRPLQRPTALTKTTNQVATMMEELRNCQPANDDSDRFRQVEKLESLVKAIPYLSLKEQGEIGKELRKGYTELEERINAWKRSGADRDVLDVANESLQQWKRFNSLVGPQPNKSN
ncbi:hypothetical protein H0H93_013284 [Arthromyces matolae]|nr:hypothetical protein H0H93_013284 [Arthromyces matolae]